LYATGSARRPADAELFKEEDAMAKDMSAVAGRKRKFQLFDLINYIVFILLGLIILVPIWKVVVDSLNSVGVYQFRLFPHDFTLDGYKVILSTSALYRPFINSVITTVLGTFLGLTLSTLGGYVLVKNEVPGRTGMAYFLLFTMIFSGGMIPEYLVMKQIGLTDSMWILVFKHGMNVYNLVLMKNFFENIPESLYEAAEIDGCSPMGTFFRIVLPLSKAALASIGLMFAVTIWNDYSTVKIYIMNPTQVNFQYKLRNMIMDGDTPTTQYAVSQTTLFNAGIVAAILPFMILYPFLQQYFVQGVNIGAVKE
jgi:putative aldouronate transport system permease protein